MKRLSLLLVVLVIFTLVLAACGGDDPEPTAVPAAAEPAAPAEVAAAPAASAGDAANGEALYGKSCIACHGPGGVGVQGLGKDMTTSEFIAAKTDDELLEFLKVGRAPDDPLNTTGVLMPPKGGNPAFTDQDLLDVIAYVRTLHKQ
jgi:mono/diheme cytochrome c family protein